jgi:hypothetical protein
MADLPTGTVTFLVTAIEGSTKLWEEHPDAMRRALARHDGLLRAAIETHGGHVFKTMGDAFCAAFAHAPDAVDAALAIQQSLRSLQPSAVTTAPLRFAVPHAFGAPVFGQRPLQRCTQVVVLGLHPLRPGDLSGSQHVGVGLLCPPEEEVTMARPHCLALSCFEQPIPRILPHRLQESIPPFALSLLVER